MVIDYIERHNAAFGSLSGYCLIIYHGKIDMINFIAEFNKKHGRDVLMGMIVNKNEDFNLAAIQKPPELILWNLKSNNTYGSFAAKELVSKFEERYTLKQVFISSSVAGKKPETFPFPDHPDGIEVNWPAYFPKDRVRWGENETRIFARDTSSQSQQTGPATSPPLDVRKRALF